MPDELVLDASVAAKYFFDEPGQAEAAALVISGAVLMAPDLIFAEMASIASKKVRRGQVHHEVALEAVRRLPDVLSEAVPAADLAEAAFELAARHGFSAYDGFYLALAQGRGAPLATADAKLVVRATACGLGSLILGGAAI